MAEVDWLRVPQGYERGVYRITHLEDRSRLNWRLSVVTDPEPGWQGATFVTISSHGSLRAAMSSARYHEMERIHSARIRRHIVTGIAATLAMIAAVSIVGAAGGALAPAILGVVAFGVALHSYAIAVDIRLGDGWGHLYREPEEASPADRFVAWVADRLRYSLGANTVESPSPIRVITAEEQRLRDSHR